MKKIEFLEHTADIKFRVYGNNLKDIFKNSAEALKKSICRKEKIKENIIKKIKVGGEDYENLLYEFLEELLYLLDANNFIFSEIKKIKIQKDKKELILDAEIIGDSAEKYKISNDVKAITYNDMFVKKQKNKFIAQVVLDV